MHTMRASAAFEVAARLVLGLSESHLESRELLLWQEKRRRRERKILFGAQ